MSYIQSNSVFYQPAFPAGVVALNQNISAADSGKIIILLANASTGAVQSITLPALQAGLTYKFIASEVIARAIVMTSPVANAFVGTLLINNAGVTNPINKAGTTTFDFTATAALGDYVEIICDGEYYYIHGVSSVAAGFA